MKTIILDWSRAKNLDTGRKAFWRNHIYWRARDSQSPLRVELRNLYANILLDEDRLESMTIEPGDCCHACVWGDAYDRVYERLRRRLDRANQLERKLWYDAGNYGPLRPVSSWRV